jgi:hypothetical protein
MSKVIATKAKLENLADKIRTKTGESSLMTIDQMAEAVDNLSGDSKEAIWLGPSNTFKYTETYDIPEEAYLVTKSSFGLVSDLPVTGIIKNGTTSTVRGRFVDDWNDNHAEWTKQITYLLNEFQEYDGLIYDPDVGNKVVNRSVYHYSGGVVPSLIESALVSGESEETVRYLGLPIYYQVVDCVGATGVQDPYPKGSTLFKTITTKSLDDIEVIIDLCQLTRNRNMRVSLFINEDNAQNCWSFMTQDTVEYHTDPVPTTTDIPETYNVFVSQPVSSTYRRQIIEMAYGNPGGYYTAKFNDVPPGTHTLCIEVLHAWTYHTKIYSVVVKSNNATLKNEKKNYRIIGNNTFKNMAFDLSTLNSKKIYIGSSAFHSAQEGSRTYNSLSIDNAEYIGANAFNNCKATIVNLNITTDYLGAAVFKDCTNIYNIDIDAPNIYDYTFQNCQNLETVVLRNTISIGLDVFRGCNSMTDFYIPSTITTIHQNAFRNATITGTTFHVNMTQAEFTALNLSWNWSASGATFIFTDTV